MTGVAMIGKAGKWETIGSLAENSLWLDDPDAGDPIESFATSQTQTLTFTIPAAIDADCRWFERVSGLAPEPDPRPEHALMFTYKVPFHDVAPRKRRRLTGKKYRQARRAFRRSRTAWVRAGRPMLDAAMYFPRVRIEEVR